MSAPSNVLRSGSHNVASVLRLPIAAASSNHIPRYPPYSIKTRALATVHQSPKPLADVWFTDSARRQNLHDLNPDQDPSGSPKKPDERMIKLGKSRQTTRVFFLPCTNCNLLICFQLSVSFKTASQRSSKALSPRKSFLRKSASTFSPQPTPISLPFPVGSHTWRLSGPLQLLGGASPSSAM